MNEWMQMALYLTKHEDPFDIMGDPPSTQEKGFENWGFEPVRSSTLAKRQPRVVNTYGTFNLSSARVTGQGSPESTLCYDFAGVRNVKTTYDMNVKYDWYCFTLTTSALLEDVMNVNTAVLVRLVDPIDRGSLLLDVTLAAPGHFFYDPYAKMKITLNKMSRSLAQLTITRN